VLVELLVDAEASVEAKLSLAEVIVLCSSVTVWASEEMIERSIVQDSSAVTKVCGAP